MPSIFAAIQLFIVRFLCCIKCASGERVSVLTQALIAKAGRRSVPPAP